MIRPVLLAGLLAGLIAGVAGFAAQAVKVTPLIHEAEVHEAAARARALMSPGRGAPSLLTVEAEPDPLLRTGLTLAASLLAGAGFGLVLAGAIAFSGRRPGPGEGLLWGAAGFAAFALAPALVLPPHLPGMAEGPLAARQLLWLAAAGSAGTGLALAAFAGRPAVRALGIGLLALPFVLPGPEAGTGVAGVPPDLAARFAAASLAAMAAFWAVLGLALSQLLRRFLPDSAVNR
jgi:cobalt transporter subunit CbtA